MEDIGKISAIQLIPALGAFGYLNYHTVINTWIVIALLVIFAVIVRRRLSPVPGRLQALVEMYVSGFDGLVSDSLGFESVEKNRKLFPLIASLFLFLILSNYLGLLPGFGGGEPTADYNTPMSLALMTFVLWNYWGIKERGIKPYLKGFVDPHWVMVPLNLLGEISPPLSMSFRIFGNIMGGGIIAAVVSQLLYYVAVPVPLTFFFGLFGGTIQAFVFTMLALTYIGVRCKE